MKKNKTALAKRRALQLRKNLRAKGQYQTGKRKSKALDRSLKAKAPGFRISKSGKRYYEARRNRSDRKGKKT